MYFVKKGMAELLNTFSVEQNTNQFLQQKKVHISKSK